MDWGRTGSSRSESKDPLRVGLLGVQADTANLGLAALAYSVVGILDRAIPGECEFVLFSVNSDRELERMRAELGIDNKRMRAVPFRHKQLLKMMDSVMQIRSCDVVVDFTGGDSFSDIYGLKRLLRKLFHKQLVLATGTPLVLAPQTYGPVRNRFGKPWFGHVVRRAALVFTRDDLSVGFLETLTDREIHVATDVAVTLPHDEGRHGFPDDGRTRVGINVSGLLWAGGYTGDNQFGLAADYRAYCGALVEALLAIGHEVHLVPHVLSRPWESDLEDDVRAARELQELHPRCLMAPPFTSPVDAKSWICHLDGFVGSRMHATIAAFTSGVPTVPAAYSRKFAGFFGNLGYPVVVDLTKQDTDEAVAATIAHLENMEQLRELAAPARQEAQMRIGIFSDRLGSLLAAHW
nr:polysaccharide pyruvyl transferase family protein [Tessaracoccus sp. OS52]